MVGAELCVLVTDGSEYPEVRFPRDVGLVPYIISTINTNGRENLNDLIHRIHEQAASMGASIVFCNDKRVVAAYKQLLEPIKGFQCLSLPFKLYVNNGGWELFSVVENSKKV